jgi:transcriptional regulator with XRE-family HTH domain
MKMIHVKGKNPLAEDFAKSVDRVDSQVEFTKLIAVEELLQFMKRQGISRTNLAQRLGVAPSRITAMLSGDSNLTIDTLVRAGHAVGADLKQTFVPKGHKVRWIHYPSSSVDRHSIQYALKSVTPVTKALVPMLNNDTTANQDDSNAA